MDMNLGKLRETVRDREAWRAAALGVSKSQTRLGDWTTTNLLKVNIWRPKSWCFQSLEYMQQKRRDLCTKTETRVFTAALSVRAPNRKPPESGWTGCGILRQWNTRQRQTWIIHSTGNTAWITLPAMTWTQRSQIPKCVCDSIKIRYQHPSFKSGHLISKYTELLKNLWY